MMRVEPCTATHRLAYRGGALSLLRLLGQPVRDSTFGPDMGLTYRRLCGGKATSRQP